jgi:hypothetical protein
MTGRERRILGRAVRAGGAVGILLALLLGIGLAGGGGAASAIGALLGLALGALIACGWSLLALGLDIAARERPSTPRMLWTAGLSGLALLLSLLALAAGTTATGLDG